jgi:hypothetical protein
MIDENGRPDILLADALAYGTGKYYTLKKAVGNYGFSKKEYIKEEIIENK